MNENTLWKNIEIVKMNIVEVEKSINGLPENFHFDETKSESQLTLHI